MTLKCNCEHAFQDSTYGDNMRVHNPTSKDGVFRCTVCTKERGMGGAVVKGKGSKK